MVPEWRLSFYMSGIACGAPEVHVSTCSVCTCVRLVPGSVFSVQPTQGVEAGQRTLGVCLLSVAFSSTNAKEMPESHRKYKLLIMSKMQNIKNEKKKKIFQKMK
jgi:hypothetical protein